MSQLSEENRDALEQFVNDALETRKIWVLEDEEGLALYQSDHYKDVIVMLFWSSRDQAQAHCIEDWEGYQPIEVNLDDFLENWVMGLAEDGYLVGTDWGLDLDGPELLPENLERLLMGEDMEEFI